MRRVVQNIIPCEIHPSPPTCIIRYQMKTWNGIRRRESASPQSALRSACSYALVSRGVACLRSLVDDCSRWRELAAWVVSTARRRRRRCGDVTRTETPSATPADSTTNCTKYILHVTSSCSYWKGQCYLLAYMSVVWKAHTTVAYSRHAAVVSLWAIAVVRYFGNRT